MNSQLKVKAVSLIVFFTIISLTVQSQDMKFINLEYNCTVKSVNSIVKISIMDNYSGAYRLKVESVSFKRIDPDKSIDREIVITAEKFEELFNAVQNIKQTDLIEGPPPLLLDGDSCFITYGKGFGNSIRYYVNTPKYETDKRKLTAFLKAYELIIKSANLDPKLIFG